MSRISIIVKQILLFMRLYLMDVAGGGILGLAGVVLFLFIWGLVEGLVIYKYKVATFWRAVRQAVFVNLLSVIFGFVLFYFLERAQYSGFASLDTGSHSLPLWIVLWALSVLIEGLLLKALNRSRPWLLVLKASVVMNLVTYIILFAYAYTS